MGINELPITRQAYWNSKGFTSLKWDQNVYWWEESSENRREHWISLEKDQIWEDLPPHRQEFWISSGKSQDV